MFFFFKQKTAYEMRISDWSSDVCSSDLIDRNIGVEQHDLTLLRRLRISLVETALPDTQRLHFRAVKRNARLDRVTDRIVESRLAVVGHELDRKSVVEGKSVSERVGLGGSRIVKKTKTHNNCKHTS